jgi:putative NADH-flavin reductase
MNLLILGATGGTGRALVQQALEQGHVVTAFARDPSKMQMTNPNLRIAKGDILDYSSVEAAVRGQDAVLSALGVRVRVGPFIAIVVLCQLIARFAALTGPAGWLVRIGVPVLANLILYRRTTTLSEGTKNIIRAMEAAGVNRLVCQSSLSIGDSKGQLGFLYNYLLIPILLRNIFADKEIQEKIIQESNLDWVIVRPGALTNGPRTGVYRSGFDATDKSIKAKISRADVADFMLKQLTTISCVSKTPGISY